MLLGLVHGVRNSECHRLPVYTIPNLTNLFFICRDFEEQAPILRFHTPSHDTTIVSGHLFAVDDFGLPKHSVY